MANWLKSLISWNKKEQLVGKKAEPVVNPEPEQPKPEEPQIEETEHVDTYEADDDDLVLLVENEIDLYENRLMPMYENLTRKKLRGVYDKRLAPKLFMYVVEEAAKRWYERMVEWADDGKSIVNKPTKEVKQLAAEELAIRFETSFENKEYDFMTELEEKYKKRMPKKQVEEPLKEVPELDKEAARPPKPVDPLGPDEEYVFDPTTNTWIKQLKKVSEEAVGKQAVEFNEENVRAEMAKVFVVDDEDLEVIDEKDLFAVSYGKAEYKVVENEDAAEKMALDLVTEELESEPELFTQSWLQQFLEISDTDKRLIAQDMVDSRVDDMDNDEVLGEVNTSGLDYADLDEVEIIEKAKEDLKEKLADEIEKELDDPIKYFVDDQGMYSIEDLLKQSFIRINIEEAAADAISVDGWPHFLATYDGNYDTTKSGFVYWRTN